MILTIIIILIVVYFIGKYISARNRDSNRQNTAQFGESLSSLAKNIGCLFTLGFILFIVLALYFIFSSKY